MTTETELRDRLYSAAWRVGPGGDDRAVADAVISRRRTERRQRAAVLAAGVVVLVVAVLVPVVGQRWLIGRAPAGPGTATPTAAATTAVSPGPTDLWTEPTRGSLAGDTVFLEAVRALEWPAATPAPPVAARTVVLAGDAGGIRWVLVAGRVAGRVIDQWFTGPAGAAANALTDDGQEDLQGGLPISHVHPDATGATLLVLSEPGDEVQVSPAVVVDADGRPHRSYTSVPADDGVAVVHEPGAFAGTAVRFRVLRDGHLAGAGPSGSAFTVPPDLGDAARQAPRRPSSGSAPQGPVMNAMQQVLDATGFAPADVHPVLLWTGPLPLEGGGASTQAVVLALTMPSGAVVTTTAFGTQDIALPSGLCGSAVHPAGTPLDSLVVVARCDTSMSTGGRQSFVVSAPRADDRVVLRSPDGTSLAEKPLVNGSGVVPAPGTVATASVSGPSGSVQVTPTNDRHDPFDVN